MAVSKKDFEAVALIINLVRDRNRDSAGVLLQVAQQLAAHFEVVNPNFNRTKFLSACFNHQEES